MKTKSKSTKKYFSRSQERGLIAQYQYNGDINALNTLINAHTPYIQKVASKEFIKFGKIVEYEDLVQEGRVGLLKAIQKFDLEKTPINPTNNKIVYNQALLTYAHNWIIAEMQTLFHRSHAAHVPAHTIRSTYCNVKNPGCNTEERKILAKLAMRSDSLNINLENDPELDYKNTQYLKLSPLYVQSSDPTFEEGTKNIFSPSMTQIINKLTKDEWEIFSMRYGISENMITKVHHIAEIMQLPIPIVEKKLKRAKRILTKYILPMKNTKETT